MRKAVSMGVGMAEEIDKGGLSEGLRPCFVKAAFITLPGGWQHSQPEATVQGREAWTPDSQIPLTPAFQARSDGFSSSRCHMTSHECRVE